jgi:hypothetical protein
MWYSHSHPWYKPAYPPEQTDPCPAKKKKKLKNKQGNEKEHTTEGAGCSK